MEDSRTDPPHNLLTQTVEGHIVDHDSDDEDEDDDVSQVSMEEGETLNLDEIKKERARCIVELKTFVLVI